MSSLKTDVKNLYDDTKEDVKNLYDDTKEDAQKYNAQGMNELRNLCHYSCSKINLSNILLFVVIIILLVLLFKNK